MDRRTFLKISAMTAATAAAHRSAWAGDTAMELQPDLQWHKAPCRFCGTGCHVMVGVRDGRVVAVAGDEKAPVNRGLLCAKGYHAGMALYGTDRLTQPLVRENGRLVPISWDRAIDIVADRIARGPDRFAFYGSGQWTIPGGLGRRSPALWIRETKNSMVNSVSSLEPVDVVRDLE